MAVQESNRLMALSEFKTKDKRVENLIIKVGVAFY